MTTKSSRSAIAARAVLLLLAGGSAGCAGDEGPGPGVQRGQHTPESSPVSSESSESPESPESSGTPAPAPAEARRVVAAYTAWLQGMQDRDARATCARHAPEMTIELRQRAILLQRAAPGDPCTGFVAVLWEDPARELDPLGIEATRVTAEDAVLAVDFPGTDETVTLANRHGNWYVADTSPRTDGTTDTSRWVRAWCDLEVGSTREEVTARMGTPSGEYTVENGGEPQLWWAQDQYDFRAYLDARGRVLDLVGDYDRLEGQDRQVLSCPELR